MSKIVRTLLAGINEKKRKKKESLVVLRALTKDGSLMTPWTHDEQFLVKSISFSKLANLPRP